jgi:hypothetical protein
MTRGRKRGNCEEQGRGKIKEILKLTLERMQKGPKK